MRSTVPDKKERKGDLMPRLLISCSIALALLSASTAYAYDEPSCTSQSCPSECPYGSYYYGNGAELEFCVFDGIVLPKNVQTACSSVSSLPIGWIGYSFPIAGNEDYQCARGLDKRVSGTTATCLAAVWPPHTNVFDYCNYLVTRCDQNYGCYFGWGWTEPDRLYRSKLLPMLLPYQAVPSPRPVPPAWPFQ